MSNYVVTGGAGFIGSHLVKLLTDQGHNVRIFDIVNPFRSNIPLRRELTKNADYISLDLSDSKAESYNELVRNLKGADGVFHLAALARVKACEAEPELSFATNVLGTSRILGAAIESNVGRVVVASSSSVYGKQDRLPLTEDMVSNPMGVYGKHKLEIEKLCLETAKCSLLGTVALRPFNVYGLGMDPNGPYALAATKFIEDWRNGREYVVFGDGTKTRDFTHVSDVCNAFYLAMRNAKVGNGEIINIGKGRNISIKYLADLVGGKYRIDESLDNPNEPHDTLADNSRAKSILGWNPLIDIEQGIEEMKNAA